MTKGRVPLTKGTGTIKTIQFKKLLLKSSQNARGDGQMLRSLRKKKNNEPDKPVISVTFSDKVTPDIDFTNEPVKFSVNDVPVVKDRRCR